MSTVTTRHRSGANRALLTRSIPWHAVLQDRFRRASASASEKKVVYGKIYQSGTSTLIGSPPAAVALELESLRKAQWRP